MTRQAIRVNDDDDQDDGGMGAAGLVCADRAEGVEQMTAIEPDPVVEWDAWLTVPEASRHLGISRGDVMAAILARRVEARTQWTPSGDEWAVWVPMTATRETWGQEADQDEDSSMVVAGIVCALLVTVVIALLIAALLWLPELCRWAHGRGV